jgi:SAM-dependent methyltransferase
VRPRLGHSWFNDHKIAEAWDRDVDLRHIELSTKYDVAYYALVSRISAAIRTAHRDGAAAILDAGCGLGVLSANLAEQGHKVTGIDLSRRAILQAQLDFGRSARFRVANIARLPRDLSRGFDVVVASMVWHNHPRLGAMVAGCRSALRENGVLIATIAEPRSYLAKQGMDHRYDVPRRFNFPLRHAQCCGTHAPVPYYHRPIEAYLHALSQNHFGDIAIASAEPDDQIARNDVVTFIGHAVTDKQPGRDTSNNVAGNRTKGQGELRPVGRSAVGKPCSATV